MTPILVFWNLAILNLVLDVLRIPDAPEKVAFRKQLAAAKSHFVAQLREREPRLHDEWLPYLLAFGLGSNVDSWFHSSGGAATAASGMTDSHRSESFGSSSSSSGELSGWTGGGGAFGGADASGSWAAAAGVLASGVASPSSSSGSGGGGGGSQQRQRGRRRVVNRPSWLSRRKSVPR